MQIKKSSPFVLITFYSLINFVLFLITKPKLQEYLVWELSDLPQLITGDLSVMKDFVMQGAIIASGILAVIEPLVMWGVLALIFRMFLRLQRVKTNFKAIVAIVLFSGYPVILGNLLRAVLIILNPAEMYAYITTGAAFLLPNDSGGALFVGLAMVDPFVVWSLALTTKGISKAFKINKINTLFFTLFIWLMFTATITGWTYLIH